MTPNKRQERRQELVAIFVAFIAGGLVNRWHPWLAIVVFIIVYVALVLWGIPWLNRRNIKE